MKDQPHSIRIELTGESYAKAAHESWPETKNHYTPLEALERTMIEHALLNWGVDKSAKEIQDLAWKLQVNMSNARHHLRKLREGI